MSIPYIIGFGILIPNKDGNRSVSEGWDNFNKIRGKNEKYRI